MSPSTFEKKSCYPCDSWFIVESEDVQDEGMKAHPVSQSLKSGGQPVHRGRAKQNYGGTPLLPELRRQKKDYLEF